MPRKPKIPPEYTSFKESVEKTGLKVTISRKYDKSIWIAAVLKDNMCIWHNDHTVHPLELDQFWKSLAWLNYEKYLAKS